ncbi:hypothetical protein [Alicyclobacillus fodiniaquatilis]|uniref:Uncharacterized protein n=1 Tax=Alicyclobacillus fodiniaquatilis TaxID=1661150 RepID=A0ABW4JCS7_9BACL
MEDKQEEINAYSNAKFYTEIRQKLLRMNLEASVIAVFTGYHTLCDPDTGVFSRDDVKIREITGLPRSTVHWATNRLFKSELIAHRVDGTHEIAGYEVHRKLDKPSYFRLTSKFFELLPTVVHHKNSGLLLFALEILDCSRHYNYEIVRNVETLVNEKRIGSTRLRALKALELLRGFADWSIFPNKRDTDDLVQFWPVKDERDESQDKLRATHGKVTRETRKGYLFAGGENPPDWRELSRSTRKIIQHGIDLKLPEDVIIRMGGLFGSLCARNKIEKRLPYLRKILKNGSLFGQLNMLLCRARQQDVA